MRKPANNKGTATKRYVARCLLTLGAVVALLSTGIGCRGSASYAIASLDMRRVSATEKLTLPVNAGECYHWVNDSGELCVALRMDNWSILGKQFSRESMASFVLGKPPASSGKNYKATRRTARFINHAGYGHTRSASLGGIIGVWDYDKPVIAGRFRLTTVQQSYSVLTGWTGKKHVLYVGEFRSVLNRTAGEALLAETEENGMARQRPIGIPRRIQGPFPGERREKKK